MQARSFSLLLALTGAAFLVGSLFASAPAVTAEESDQEIYTVRQGDTLTSIAESKGYSVAAIVQRNELSNPDSIYIGQQLLMPTPVSVLPPAPAELRPSATYRVQAGDTLSDIATRFQTSVDALVQLNGLREADLIAVGEVLITSVATPRQESTTAAARRQNPPPPAGSVQEQFVAGYRSAGGPENSLHDLVGMVIPCESSFNVRAYNPSGPYFGLLQFAASTWQESGGGDWTSAWQQGANAARLLKVADPRTYWPHCWNKH